MTKHASTPSSERSKKYRSQQVILQKRRRRNAEAQKRVRKKIKHFLPKEERSLSIEKPSQFQNQMTTCYPYVERDDDALRETTNFHSQESLKESSSGCLNQIALINTFQWRKPLPSQPEVSQEMSRVQCQIQKDLKAFEYHMNPRTKTLCSCCGKKVEPSFAEYLSQREAKEIESFLEGQVYQSQLHGEDSVHSCSNFPSVRTDKSFPFSFSCCNRCLRDLRSKRIPITARCNGWNFADTIPDVLLRLSKHERLLIALRLPCIHIWRLQGGFGQHASKGSPVSFSNPVANLAKALPWRPTAVFAPLLENRVQVVIRAHFIRSALDWLRKHNSLYSHVNIDQSAMEEIIEIECAQEEMELENSSPNVEKDPSEGDMREAEYREAGCGTQGPLDGRSLCILEESSISGVEDLGDTSRCKHLIQHMLRPFQYRRNDMIPSYDAAKNLETYFPVLFPYGRGGPETLRRTVILAFWCKHALSVHCSRFKRDLDFIFFVNAVLRRKRLSGLAFNAPLRDRTSHSLKEIRSSLENGEDSSKMRKTIDNMIRTGAVNASFECLRGSAAFWRSLKYKAWAYLVRFGPCQLFLTMSVADIIDPFVFMEIDETISYEDARKLSTVRRAQLLADNPCAATKIFHRRVDSLFNHFLFGATKPFQDIIAFLGRVEQQERKSPHLHLLIWLSSKAPNRTGNNAEDSIAIANFIETFCTATIPSEGLIPVRKLSLPAQAFPIPTITKPKIHGRQVFTMSGHERHEVLSRPCDPFAFTDSKEKRDVLRKQTIAAQSHICSTYCRPKGEPCRFMFPFKPQKRASLVKCWKQPGDLRTLALCPRTDPWLNSTHPMLTAMFRANTDVTVITGNSIAECVYVCSYAVKAEKSSLFGSSLLNRLQCINENESDDRKLLAAIARGTESVRVVGGQEVCDNLLGNPLFFLSAKVLNLRTCFLLDATGALTEDQRIQRERLRKKTANHPNILAELHPDRNVAVPQNEGHCIPGSRFHVKRTKDIDPFIQTYMLRPIILEDLTTSEFFESYIIRRSTAKERSENQDMLLIEGSELNSGKQRDLSDELSSNNGRILPRIVRLRRKPQRRPPITHILNVLDRREADEHSPNFAAAALLLHVPFRSAEDLLGGKTLTDRLQEVLQEPERYQDVCSFVQRSYEISGNSCMNENGSNVLSTSFGQSINGEEEQLNSFVDSEMQSQNDVDDLMIDIDNESIDPLVGLPPVIVRTGKKDPSKILKTWCGAYTKRPDLKVQSNEFLQYLHNCKSVGVQQANEKYLNATLSMNTSCNEIQYEQTNDGVQLFDADAVRQLKQRIYRNCRNQEQKRWLRGIFSYLQEYYSCSQPSCNTMQNIMRKNPVLITNAPGGCGKSWLIQKLKLFVSKAFRYDVHPPLDEDETNECNCRHKAQNFADHIGRLGRMAVFAPSGVAADNAGGFTFHDGLRTYPITTTSMGEELSLKKLSQLAEDFSRVVSIVIDEFSMCNICYLEYLDRILRLVRPGFSHRMFGGIPVLMTGDGFQLPVVRGQGLLSHSKQIPANCLSTFKHCTEHLFYFQLSQSVRQEKDSSFNSTLCRVRLAKATDEDVELLNTRYFSDLAALAHEDSEWTYAPILTAKNLTVKALNKAAVTRNGEKLGTSHVYSVPILSKALKQEVRKRKLELYFKHCMNDKNMNKSTTSSAGFKPDAQLVLYPGIPLMIRMNICTGLGLSNGSVGRLIAVIRRNENQVYNHAPRETLQSMIQRTLKATPRDPPYVPSLILKINQGYKGLIGATEDLDAISRNKESSKTVLIEPVSIRGIRGLPVSVAHSFTMHKSQSLTIPRTIIDPREIFCMGALYVALSRSPSLERIALIGKVTKKQLNKYREHVAIIEKRIGNIRNRSHDISMFEMAIYEKENKAFKTWSTL